MLAARFAPGRRLFDIGIGDGTVVIVAARCGFHVTATDVAPSALGRARRLADLAAAPSIVLVLDDITAPRLDASYDIAVDRGLLHSLSRDQRAAYAAAITTLVSGGGTLLVVAHAPGVELGTQPLADDDLVALLPAFALVRTQPTTLAGAPAQLFELDRRAG